MKILFFVLLLGKLQFFNINFNFFNNNNLFSGNLKMNNILHQREIFYQENKLKKKFRQNLNLLLK